MSTPNPVPEAAAPRASSRWRTTRSALRRWPIWAIVIILVVLVLPALVPQLLAPYDPLAVDLRAVLTPPVFAGGTWAHILGTDDLGRDVLSRIIYGARPSATVAVAVIAISAVVGAVLGVIAGYFGGWVDAVIMRLADAVFSVPVLLLAIVLAALLGPSLQVVITVMSFVLWAQYARIARGETIAVRERDFVTYAKIAGVNPWIILWRHIRPNILDAVLVLVTVDVAWAILVEAGLSFVGAGVPPPDPSWGQMISGGRTLLSSAWWISVFPGLAIFVVVLSANIIGDRIRDLSDPNLQTRVERAEL